MSEATEEKTIGGIVPLSDPADVLTFTGGTGSWQGEEDAEVIRSEAVEIGKIAVSASKESESLAKKFRQLAEYVLTIRSRIMVDDGAGNDVPDWGATSDLAKRFTTLVISKPIIDKGKADQLTYVQSNISAYMSKKEPGSDHSLRDRFIRDYVREHNPEMGSADVESEVDAAFATFKGNDGLPALSDRQKTKKRQDARAASTAGPDTKTAPSPAKSLGDATAALVKAENVAILPVIEEAARILTWLAKEAGKSDEVKDRPKVVKAFEPIPALAAALAAFYEGGDSLTPDVHAALAVDVK